MMSPRHCKTDTQTRHEQQEQKKTNRELVRNNQCGQTSRQTSKQRSKSTKDAANDHSHGVMTSRQPHLHKTPFDQMSSAAPLRASERESERVSTRATACGQRHTDTDNQATKTQSNKPPATHLRCVVRSHHVSLDGRRVGVWAARLQETSTNNERRAQQEK